MVSVRLFATSSGCPPCSKRPATRSRDTRLGANRRPAAATLCEQTSAQKCEATPQVSWGETSGRNKCAGRCASRIPTGQQQAHRTTAPSDNSPLDCKPIGQTRSGVGPWTFRGDIGRRLSPPKKATRRSVFKTACSCGPIKASPRQGRGGKVPGSPRRHGHFRPRPNRVHLRCRPPWVPTIPILSEVACAVFVHAQAGGSRSWGNAPSDRFGRRCAPLPATRAAVRRPTCQSDCALFAKSCYWRGADALFAGRAIRRTPARTSSDDVLAHRAKTHIVGCRWGFATLHFDSPVRGGRSLPCRLPAAGCGAAPDQRQRGMPNSAKRPRRAESRHTGWPSP